MAELGDGPVEAAYSQAMNQIARLLDEVFNGYVTGDERSERETGFVLLVFPFGESEGRCNYISNGADRGDIVRLLREQADRFEGLGDV